MFELQSESAGYNGRTFISITWYAKKQQGELVPLKSDGILSDRKLRKDTFLTLIQDQPAIAEKYSAEKQYSFDFIRNLIKSYNTASAESY